MGTRLYLCIKNLETDRNMFVTENSSITNFGTHCALNLILLLYVE
jgi:hypothetical protein